MAGECRRPAKANDLTKDLTTFQPAPRRAHGSLRYRLVPLRAPCALTHQWPYASEPRARWRGRVCTTVATGQPPPATLAQVSRRPTVRLNTSRAGVESWSGQK